MLHRAFGGNEAVFVVVQVLVVFVIFLNGLYLVQNGPKFERRGGVFDVQSSENDVRARMSGKYHLVTRASCQM